MTNEKAAELKRDEMIKVWRRIKTSLLYIDLLNSEYYDLLEMPDEIRDHYDTLGNDEIPKFIEIMDIALGLERRY